jgi:putative (di)nucleoside polyphosphate hydrolase
LQERPAHQADGRTQSPARSAALSRTRIEAEALPYRRCVGMMVLNHKGLVWVGHRIAETESEMSGAQQLWQMPQGGIDPDEEPLAGARRELFEETGMESLDLIAEAPDWIRYDLPEHLVGVAWKGKYRGQEQKWFAFRFHGHESEIRINPPPGNHAPEFDRFAWRRMDELTGLIVPFKRKVYEEVVRLFRHLAD